MARIEVSQTGESDGTLEFRVTVTEGRSTTEHAVTLARDDFERLRAGARNAEEFVGRCFRFLLEREPKESILASFDVKVILRYFPEFEREIVGE